METCLLSFFCNFLFFFFKFATHVKLCFTWQLDGNTTVLLDSCECVLAGILNAFLSESCSQTMLMQACIKSLQSPSLYCWPCIYLHLSYIYLTQYYEIILPSRWKNGSKIENSKSQLPRFLSCMETWRSVSQWVCSFTLVQTEMSQRLLDI